MAAGPERLWGAAFTYDVLGGTWAEGYHTYRYEFTWAETESSRKVVAVGHNNGFGLLLMEIPASAEDGQIVVVSAQASPADSLAPYTDLTSGLVGDSDR